MKTFKFSLVLRTRENTDVFITLDDNIYGIHIKRVNILYILCVKVLPTATTTDSRRDSLWEINFQIHFEIHFQGMEVDGWRGWGEWCWSWRHFRL